MAIQFQTKKDTPNGDIVAVVEMSFQSRLCGGRIEFWPSSFAGQIVHGVSGSFVTFKGCTETAKVIERVNAGVEVLASLLGDRVQRVSELRRRLDINAFWEGMSERGFPCASDY